MSSSSLVPASEILMRAHARLKRSSSSGASLRALASKVGVSHVFLGKIIKGRAHVPKRLVAKLSAVFQLDSTDRSALKTAVLSKDLADLGDVASTAPPASKAGFSGYVDLPERHFKYFSDWRSFAVLDLLTCEMPFVITRKAILLHIPFGENELTAFLKVMLELGLVTERLGVLEKTAMKLRIPTRGPNEHSKKLYRSVSKLTDYELNKQKSEDFEQRLIMGFSCAVNPANIPKVRLHLINAIRECAEMLSEGDCSDVFWVQGQMFSLLSRASR
ncbi:MAG: DUF4423 domain-containing protein [Proteobacteria bacterium]|nr:MAG: DUF4423 domain-containing protein [Pseudomonadota bacterium]